MSLCLKKVFVQAQRTFLLTSCSYQHIMTFGGESRRPIKHKIQRCCAAACRNDSDGGSGGGFKGTGCRAPRERHCKRKNVPRRRKPLGRKSVIADIMSVRRQVTNEERTLRGASQKTYIAEDRQQRALSPWCMDRQECAPTFPVWENAGVFFCRGSRWSFSVERRETGIFSAYGYVRSRRFFQPSAFHKGGRGESLSRLLSFLYFKFARL